MGPRKPDATQFHVLHWLDLAHAASLKVWRSPWREHTGGSGSLAVWESTSLSPRVLGFQVGDRRACPR